MSRDVIWSKVAGQLIRRLEKANSVKFHGRKFLCNIRKISEKLTLTKLAALFGSLASGRGDKEIQVAYLFSMRYY